MKQRTLPLFISALLLTGLLAGCSSARSAGSAVLRACPGAVRRGDKDKAKLEVRNVLQINAEHPQARYLWAQLADASRTGGRCSATRRWR